MNDDPAKQTVSLHAVFPDINDSRPIRGIYFDSRSVKNDSVFVAIRGYVRDGHEYIEQALKAGASVILHERDFKPDALKSAYPDVYFIAVDDSRVALAEIASRYYHEPSKDMRIVGVTGTNGKTTTSYLVKHILESGGEVAGLIGTIQNMIGTTVFSATRTTPEALELQSLFNTMRATGLSAVVMEASSHALFLHRCDAIHFDDIIFTNISEDHLDFHKSMEEYLEAKLIAFDLLAQSVKPKARIFVNAHSAYLDAIVARVAAHSIPLIRFGNQIDLDYAASNIDLSINGTSYDLYQRGRFVSRVNLSLIGTFNVLNSLAALACGIEHGYDVQAAIQSIASAQVPGRFEIVPNESYPFTVVVDYAHTDDAIRNVLDAARALKPNRIITVFGCGGDRDRKKRPLMGKAAGDGSDLVVLTNDNPRTEDPSIIIEDTHPGLDASGVDYCIIDDRRDAIQYAINNARDNDLVIIAGKGHEDYQIFHDRTIHFDDREVAKEALSVRSV